MRWCLLIVLQALCSSACVPPLLIWEQVSTTVKLALLDAFTSLLPAIFHTQRLFEPPHDDSSDRSEFDFIVVGAGVTSSPLVLRLTEQRNWTVLLLEAGGEEVTIMDIPFLLAQFQGTDANWHYVTTPQTSSCVLMEDSRCDYPAGRGIGGSSIINYMFNIRGNSRDFDNWADMGNQGWSFNDVLPYFKKIEDLQIPELQNSDYRGYGGRVRTMYPAYFSGVAQTILRSAEEAGFPLTEDYNGAQQTGAARIQTTTSDGARWSANRGYLNDVRRRPNLFLRAQSFVTRLILEGGRARGVRYVRGGKEMEAFATREVILCAGAVNSPAILMHSGIGPEDHLQEVGIPLVKNLSVGLNLMDHTAAFATFTILNETVSPSIADIVLNPRSYFDYFGHRAGPLTSTGTFETLSFHDLEGTPFYSPGWPQVEILWSSVNVAPTQKAASIFRISRRAYDRLLKPLEDKPVLMSAIWRLRPKSRGRIFLLNNDTSSPPQIDPRGLSDPEDVEVVLQGIRDFQKILAAPSFQRVGARMEDPLVPECEDIEYDSDDYWRCAMRQLSLPIFHQTGTCKMGPLGDPTAVVTPELKVVGIEGLRVADASIMPLVISGHLQMTCYMIGEKAADLIISEHST